jgi:hypothetical protein
MEIFPFYNMRKEGGNKKRVVTTQGEVPVLMRSSEVWEHAWTHALSSAPTSGERTCIGISPTTKNHN